MSQLTIEDQQELKKRAEERLTTIQQNIQRRERKAPFITRQDRKENHFITLNKAIYESIT